jgi:multidrug resistance protein
MAQLTFQTLDNTESNKSMSVYSFNNQEIATENSKTDISIIALAENELNLEKVQPTTTEKKIYPYSIKIGYLTLFGVAGLMGPLASNMNVPALELIERDFRTDYITVTITVTIFLISMSVGPLIWAMLSDAYGRKQFSITSMVIFTLGSVGCALSTSIEMLIAMRFIQGAGSSASMVIGIGVVSDIFPRSEMGRAIGLFAIGPILGPILGPIIGGYMSQYIGWRSLFYLSTGLGAALAILVAIFYKETMDNSRKLSAPIIRNNETGKLEFNKRSP